MCVYVYIGLTRDGCKKTRTANTLHTGLEIEMRGIRNRCAIHLHINIYRDTYI